MRNREIEDGMGFAGLLPTIEEKRAEADHKRTQDRIARLQTDNNRLYALNTELVGALEAMRECYHEAGAIIDFQKHNHDLVLGNVSALLSRCKGESNEAR